MPDAPDARHVATLWRLALRQDRLTCAVYRHGTGFQLRLESPAAVIFTQPFELQPRMLARTEALRASLTRRGWQEVES